MNVLLRLAVMAICLYQSISRYLPRQCRFYPSCSEYMRRGMEHHGLAQGTWLGVKRLLRCHPWHPGGYDPLPVLCDGGWDVRDRRKIGRSDVGRGGLSRPTSDVRRPTVFRPPTAVRRSLYGGLQPWA